MRLELRSSPYQLGDLGRVTRRRASGPSSAGQGHLTPQSAAPGPWGVWAERPAPCLASAVASMPLTLLQPRLPGGLWPPAYGVGSLHAGAPFHVPLVPGAHAHAHALAQCQGGLRGLSVIALEPRNEAKVFFIFLIKKHF